MDASTGSEVIVSAASVARRMTMSEKYLGAPRATSRGDEDSYAAGFVVAVFVPFVLGLFAGALAMTNYHKELAYADRCEAVGGELEGGEVCTRGDSVLWRVQHE
jgi:hypothetical protein